MDFLKEILDAPLYASLCDALKGKGQGGRDLTLLPGDGSYVPLGKFNEVLQAKKALEKDVGALAELQTLRDQNARLLQARREDAVHGALAAMEVKSQKAARALLELPEGWEEDDGLLQDALDKLREQHPYLFAAQKAQFTGISLCEGQGADTLYGKASFGALCEEERRRLREEDGEGYRRAYEEHVRKTRKIQ